MTSSHVKPDTAITLDVIAEAVGQLTKDAHLPMPSSVVVASNRATIMSDLPGAPVHGLLMWANHLDGEVTYHASLLWRNKVNKCPLTIEARGTLDGIPVTIWAMTRERIRRVDETAEESVPLQVSLTELLALTATETVLPI